MLGVGRRHGSVVGVVLGMVGLLREGVGRAQRHGSVPGLALGRDNGRRPHANELF